jgi:hypothetical protein
MTEEYPDLGTGDKSQEIDTGRTEARASADGGTQPPSAAGSPPEGDLPPTGDDRADAAAAGLSRLRGLPVDEHVAVLEEVYGRLRDILGELDEEAEPPGMPKGRP